MLFDLIATNLNTMANMTLPPAQGRQVMRPPNARTGLRRPPIQRSYNPYATPWAGARDAAGNPRILGTTKLGDAATMQNLRARTDPTGSTPTAEALVEQQQTQRAADKLKKQTIFASQYENWKRKYSGQPAPGTVQPGAPTVPVAPAAPGTGTAPLTPKGAPALQPAAKTVAAPPATVKELGPESLPANSEGMDLEGNTVKNSNGWSDNHHINWGNRDDVGRSQISQKYPDPRTSAGPYDAMAPVTGGSQLETVPSQLDANSQRIVNEGLGLQPTAEQISNRRQAEAAHPLSGEFTKMNPATGMSEITPEAKTEIDADNDKLRAAKKGGRMPIQKSAMKKAAAGGQAFSNSKQALATTQANDGDADDVLAGEAGPEIKVNDDKTVEPINQPTILRGGKPGVIIPHKAIMGLKSKFDKPIKKLMQGKALKRAAMGGRVGDDGQAPIPPVVGIGNAGTRGAPLGGTNRTNLGVTIPLDPKLATQMTGHAYA